MLGRERVVCLVLGAVDLDLLWQQCWPSSSCEIAVASSLSGRLEGGAVT